MRVLLLIVVAACGNASGSIDAGPVDSTIVVPGRELMRDAGSTVQEWPDPDRAVELELRFGHFVADLDDAVFFCVVIDGELQGAHSADGVSFRELTDWVPFSARVSSEVRVEVSASPDCDSILFATPVDELRDGKATVVASGLMVWNQRICGERYDGTCHRGIHARAWHWWDVTDRYPTQARLVDLSPNTYGLGACDGEELVLRSGVGLTASAFPDPVAIDPTADADWFFIRSSVFADRCDESPDVLARLSLPVETARSPRIARTIEEGDSILFIASGIVRLPGDEGRDDSLEITPWRD